MRCATSVCQLPALSFLLTLLPDESFFGLIRITLNGEQHHLYARSFLYYGVEEFIKKEKRHLLQKWQLSKDHSEDSIANPCMNNGDLRTVGLTNMYGTGDPAACYNMTLKILNSTQSRDVCGAHVCTSSIMGEPQPKVQAGMFFQAMAGFYWYVLKTADWYCC